jgi:hypothetical protein
MITLTRGQTYWLDHPKHGTQRGRLLISSDNLESLAFALETPIGFDMGGGVLVSEFLLITYKDGEFRDLHTESRWQVTEGEPAVKHPTK